MDSVLKIKKLVKKFGSIEILKNIDIEINKGDFLVLVGSFWVWKINIVKLHCRS